MLLLGVAHMTPAHAASAGSTTLSEPVNLVLAVLLTALIATLTLVLLILQRQRRMRSDRRLGEQAALLSNLITDLPEMVFYKDRRGVYRLCNKLGSEFLGRPCSEVIGKTDADFFDRLTAETLRLHDDEATERESITQNEEWLTDADGKSVLLDVRRQPLVSEKGHRNGVLITCRDITESKQIQRELEYQARHDSLTGLANRYLLQEQLSFALQMARRNEESLAVIFIDLDRFKDINDAIGHTIGDLLLRDVAHRLRTNLRDSDICARLSGDEFVIVLTQTDGAHITEKCDQLLAELALPYQLQGHLLSIFASAGIAIAPEHGNNTEILLAHADAALHQAKALGRNRSCVYTPELTLNQNNQLSLEQDLRQAVLNEEFTLVFQPQFRVDETTPRRAETLIRWPHEFRGLISPHEFIPLAETTGLVKELGLWVIREAAKQFLAWREEIGRAHV